MLTPLLLTLAIFAAGLLSLAVAVALGKYLAWRAARGRWML